MNYHCIDNTSTDLVLSTQKEAASVVCVVEELGRADSFGYEEVKGQGKWRQVRGNKYISPC